MDYNINFDLNKNDHTFQLKFLIRQRNGVTDFSIRLLTMDGLLFTTLAASRLTATSHW